MINFFRSIRKGLLENQKFSNYTLYAVGEIILVVIGILIALQINNWNENRKDKIYEKKMLMEVMEDLKIDTSMLSVQFNRINRFEKSIEYVLGNQGKWNIASDMDIHLFGGVYFSQNTKALESIKSNSVQIPFDDDLRKLINTHYHRARFYLELLDREDKTFNEFRSLPVQKSLFKVQLNPDAENFDINPVPIDPETINESKEFQDFLLLRKARVLRWKWAYKNIQESTEECLEAISNYLIN